MRDDVMWDVLRRCRIPLNAIRELDHDDGRPAVGGWLADDPERVLDVERRSG